MSQGRKRVLVREVTVLAEGQGGLIVLPCMLSIDVPGPDGLAVLTLPPHASPLIVRLREAVLRTGETVHLEIAALPSPG